MVHLLLCRMGGKLTTPVAKVSTLESSPRTPTPFKHALAEVERRAKAKEWVCYPFVFHIYRGMKGRFCCRLYFWNVKGGHSCSSCHSICSAELSALSSELFITQAFNASETPVGFRELFLAGSECSFLLACSCQPLC